MVPRPRVADDTAILTAVFRIVASKGPAALTLADVAAEVGLSAAALVQRFGSKRELLLAAAADAASGHALLFAEVRDRHASPLAALLGLADCMSVLGRTPSEVGNTLAFLHGSIADREFRRHARTGAETFQAGLRSLLRDAMAAGEIGKGDATALARALHALLFGSALTWAIDGDGDLASWLRRDLRQALRRRSQA